MALRKIHWRPSKLIEDPLTGDVYVLMYGGSGRVRYLLVTDIQDPIWSEEEFKRKKNER